MEFIDVTHKLPTDGNFNYYPLGDAHFGARSHARGVFGDCIKEIYEDPIGVCSDGGDTISGICSGDKRWNEAMHYGAFATIDQQVDGFIRVTAPIHDKFLWIINGNHSMTTENIIKASKKLAEGIGCPWPGCAVKAKMGKFKVLDTHGSGSVNSQAGDFEQRLRNDGIKVKRKLRNMAGDCELMIMHHIHKGRWCKPDFEQFNVITNDTGDGFTSVYNEPVVKANGVIDEDHRWYLSGFAFQKSQMLNEMRIDEEGNKWKAVMDTYALKAMYSPTELGMWRVEVRDWKIDRCARGVGGVKDVDGLFWRYI